MQTKNSKFIAVIWIVALMLTLLIIGPISGERTFNETELEISNVDGSLGAVVVEVKNAGDISADGLAILTYVTGGLFDNIELYHQCAGCDTCGTTLEPGMTKTESTREAGLLFGFGTIEILVTASASNADEVSVTLNGFIFGPFVII